MDDADKDRLLAAFRAFRAEKAAAEAACQARIRLAFEHYRQVVSTVFAHDENQEAAMIFKALMAADGGIDLIEPRT